METAEYQKMQDAEDSMWWYLATRKCMLSFLSKFLGDTTGRVLDGGCGTGGFLRLLGDVLPNAERVGIELNQWAVKASQSTSDAHIVCGSVNQLPFRNNVFTGIVSTDVIYHQQVDDHLAISEAYRCLEPGGVLLIQAPAYKWMRSAHDARVSGARRYTRSEIEAMLEGAGFSIVVSTYRNTLLFPLMAIHRILSKGDAAGSDVKKYPSVIETMFRAILSVEQAILNVGVVLPFGGSVLVAGRKHV